MQVHEPQEPIFLSQEIRGLFQEIHTALIEKSKEIQDTERQIKQTEKSEEATTRANILYGMGLGVLEATQVIEQILQKRSRPQQERNEARPTEKRAI